MAGADVHVFSKARKSKLYGAQYLHAPIPGIDPGESLKIDYQLFGTVDGYRQKVYGPDYDGEVSPGSLPPGHPAWDIRATYNYLWDEYHGVVHEATINPTWLREELPRWHCDAVFSTIPAMHTCQDLDHGFLYRNIWAMGDAPDIGQFVTKEIMLWPHGLEEGQVICNGHDHPAWYRTSLIFGHATIEWPGHIRSQPVGSARVPKPLSTNCNCFPHITRLGRYGKWQKGALVHEVYAEVQECLISQSLR
jgi:hypothetical protein